MAELTAHVDAGAMEARTDADMRNMLDALGDPDDIVSGAMPPAREKTGPTRRMVLGLGVAAALVAILLGLLAIVLVMGLTGAGTDSHDEPVITTDATVTVPTPTTVLPG